MLQSYGDRGGPVADLLVRGASRGSVARLPRRAAFVRLRRNVQLSRRGDPPGISHRHELGVDYAAAPTIGIDARIELGPHLSLVPGVHAAVVSVSETNGLLVRPRVAVRWEF